MDRPRLLAPSHDTLIRKACLLLLLLFARELSRRSCSFGAASPSHESAFAAGNFTMRALNARDPRSQN